MSVREELLIDGRTGKWEIVIGLEVHAQVISEAKLFSGAATAFGADPNSQVSPVDAGFPGMLPVINRHCVEQAVKTGLGLEAEINPTSVFDRKNYFYADLPQGYQISQFSQPIVGKGQIHLDMPDGSVRTVGITRLHLEQDAGKSLHDQHPSLTYIDLNRSGVALMEIVSEPDMRSAEEAGAYLKKLRSILRYLGTCDGNMEEGSMRCDVNVSVRKPGAALGTRCEIKNVNSIRFVMQAIEYEARRQVEIIEEGGTIRQETRLFDSTRGDDPDHALQGRGARLPLFPRSRPAAAGAGAELGRTAPCRRCRSCPMPRRRASSPSTSCRPTTPACWSPRRRWPPITRRLPRAAIPSSRPIG